MSLPLDRFMRPGLNRRARTETESARTAARLHLTWIGGAIAILGLILLDASASGAGGFETGALLSGWLLPFTLAIALPTSLVTSLLARRFRAQARDERRLIHELDAAAETLRALIGTLTHGVILTDPHGHIRLFSPGAELVFGRFSEETSGLPIARLLPELELDTTVPDDPLDPATTPRIIQTSGLRAGQRFPLRLLIRPLKLDDEGYWMLLAEDLTDLERSSERTRYLEQYDTLTGLQNRLTFERILQAIDTSATRAMPLHALCLFDVDHLRSTNETLGHEAGTRLIEQLARIAMVKLATATALARLNGDEIAALFVGTSARRAAALCEALIDAVREVPCVWRDRTLDMSVSAGLVIFDPARTPASTALGQAGIACRIAKSKGGNRLHRYTEQDTESIRYRDDLAMVPTIGRSLSDGRFLIMAQTIQPLSGQGPPHFEILIRLDDPQAGRVVPAHGFIPTAERHVLMPAIDRWVISQVFAQEAERLRRWHRRFPDRFMLAINLSGTTLLDEGFSHYLHHQFAEHAVPYPSICFEITETAALADLHRARRFMQELHARGTPFAVDDFGTGFASYTYLKSLPIRYLKIDGSFVSHLESDPIDRAIVASINQIGHVLGLETIAEWVETPTALALLREMGVDHAQGFGIDAPIALEALRLDAILDEETAEHE